MSGSKEIFNEILRLYGSRSGEMLTGLLNNERFIQGVEKLLIASLEFRDLLQKSIQAAFEQINIPTRNDLEKIVEGQRDLEDRLFSIEETLQRIEKKIEKQKKTSRKTAAGRKSTEKAS